LYESLGWNVVLLCFYLPGAAAGAIASDYLGPKYTLALGVFLQAIFGFIMSGQYANLEQHIAGFVVICMRYLSSVLTVDGLFLTFGEFGPGDNIGLLSAKLPATAIRGQFYGIAAAVGKLGAFTGAYAFTDVMDLHY
jgi:Sugar (and other) transporter